MDAAKLLQNKGEHSMLLCGSWDVAHAYKDDKDVEIIRQLSAEVLQVCGVLRTEPSKISTTVPVQPVGSIRSLC